MNAHSAFCAADPLRTSAGLQALAAWGVGVRSSAMAGLRRATSPQVSCGVKGSASGPAKEERRSKRMSEFIDHLARQAKSVTEGATALPRQLQTLPRKKQTLHLAAPLRFIIFQLSYSPVLTMMSCTPGDRRTFQ